MIFPEAPYGYGVKDAFFAYGNHQVLSGATLSIIPGEIHALVGGHHAGKSTLCSLLSGRNIPDAGAVVARGQAFSNLTPRKAKELGVAGVSRNTRIYPRLTVLKNLIMGDSARWFGLWPHRYYYRKVRRWLDEYGIDISLSDHMHEVPRDRWVVVEILTKLFQKPRLLILDEAIEELSQPWLNQIMGMIRRYLEGGMGMLFVTHRIEDALDIADRVSVMRNGKVILTNSAMDMERLNLIRLCYAQLDGFDGQFSSQETFQELMRYTEAMLRDLPTAIIILDPALNVRFVNQRGQQLFAEALRDKRDFLGPNNERLRRLVTEARDSLGETVHHAVPIASDQGKIIADVRVQTIRERDVVVGGMVIIEDVSLREDLRRRLVLSEQLSSIGLLAAGVAHEVNNPLEILGNYLNYLRDDATSADTLEVITRMDEEIVRIHEITNNLVAHTSANRPADETVDIMALVRETAGLLQFHGSFRDVDFICEENGGQALVRASSPELRQVFLNLIRNSLDAMPEGGEVRIISETSPDSAEVTITVSDSGPGIRLDNPNDVFLPFVSTKKGQGPHQGLGLYIVYGIIEKYGGKISVDTPAQGGCQFTLRFPLRKSPQ